ncbi:Planctomycete cytochrome C [Planctomycetes bacterium Pan216]|uniref:Planctomycete cytochrome C n=1 Tax=Kolteria novifilia TaxID=2527975 RepID=A0A518B476_9BACT|nr:Planctomycete cytochrome C [Planctomycetes bacterium Pan216]
MRPGLPIVASLFLLFGALPSLAADMNPADVEFFEKKIRPVLAEHCYSCHAADSKTVMGGLLLDAAEPMLTGGDSGPAVVPGKPKESLLLDALRHESFEMPPTEKLPEQVIADFEKWIAKGALDPRKGKFAHKRPRSGIDVEQGRKFWAFQHPQRTAPPSTKNKAWPRGTIDRHILAKLEAEGVAPSQETDRRGLLRRASYALTGLPPTPTETRAFLEDDKPDAFARAIDRLMASPRFGERWGRHWLDIARYADSTGLDQNLTYFNAWRYRDYVVDAFNDDKPYDQFILEQIAGDLLDAQTPEERDEKVIATGYLVLGPKVAAERDKEKLRMDAVDEQIETISKSILGLTVSCARCHDHKFDPIAMNDYYALAGILRSTRTIDGIKQNNQYVSGWMLRPLGPEGDQQYELAKADVKKIKDLSKKVSKVKKSLKKLQDQAKKAASETKTDQKASGKDQESTENAPTTTAAKKKKSPTLDEKIAEATAQLKKLESSLAEVNKTKTPMPPLAMAVRDEDNIEDIALCIRGNHKRRGEVVPRGFVEVACNATPVLPSHQSGRRELAEWLASEENPLTARVMANRIWHHLFGSGLVRTVDNFGELGERPSHPELLDYLATRFVEEGWSVKSLIREIMLSRTYALSTEAPGDCIELDPDNRFFGRANRRRLDAEAVRDTLLALGGELDLTMNGSTIDGFKEVALDNNAKLPSFTKHRRRSVYLPIIRNGLPEALETFDVANPNVSTGKRGSTTVVTQALFMVNSPWVASLSESLAESLLANGAIDERSRVREAYERVLNRLPTEDEEGRCLAYLAEWADPEHPKKTDDAVRREGWTTFCQALFSSSEFRFVE